MQLEQLTSKILNNLEARGTHRIQWEFRTLYFNGNILSHELIPDFDTVEVLIVKSRKWIYPGDYPLSKISNGIISMPVTINDSLFLIDGESVTIERPSQKVIASITNNNFDMYANQYGAKAYFDIIIGRLIQNYQS